MFTLEILRFLNIMKKNLNFKDHRGNLLLGFHHTCNRALQHKVASVGLNLAGFGEHDAFFALENSFYIFYFK